MKVIAPFPPGVNSLYGVRATIQTEDLMRILVAVRKGTLQLGDAAAQIRRHMVAFPYKTKEHKDYVEAFRSAAGAGSMYRLPSLLEMTVDSFRPRRIGDVDAPLKALLDCAQGVLYENDSQLAKLTITRGDDKNNPRVEVNVTELATSGAQLDLVDPSAPRPRAKVVSERPALTKQQLALKAKSGTISFRSPTQHPQEE